MKFTDIKFEKHPMAIHLTSPSMKDAMSKVEGFEDYKNDFMKWDDAVISKVETKSGVLSIVGGTAEGGPLYCGPGTYEVMIPGEGDVEGWKTPEDIEKIIEKLNQ